MNEPGNMELLHRNQNWNLILNFNELCCELTNPRSISRLIIDWLVWTVIEFWGKAELADICKMILASEVDHDYMMFKMININISGFKIVDKWKK
jgi:hypothetical protein